MSGDKQVGEEVSRADAKGAAIDVQLADWQVLACDAWQAGDDLGPNRGTLEIFTGGGKSLIALECWRRVAQMDRRVRLVVVVPTLALARQWRQLILDRTDLHEGDVGSLDGSRKDDLTTKSCIVAVLNTSSQLLPELVERTDDSIFLVVDECHRAGAPQFSRVLSTRAEYRLGLSATAEREDVDEEGNPIDYDEHVLGRQLGQIVYQFDLRKAREIGWLPDFTVFHHAIDLTAEERRRYEELTRKIDDLADRLRDLGIDRSTARGAASREGDVGVTARSYVAAVALRKDLLYRAQERSRVVGRILDQLQERVECPRVLLFHERIDEAEALFHQLAESMPVATVGLEHSRLPDSVRRDALARFGDGRFTTLVSVKSLVEGIDVPDADVGVSVASSASVRQRVQALGRVLRRRFAGEAKKAEMHLLYVSSSADEAIYGKEDWSDLTGEAPNHYLHWALGADAPMPLDGPPLTPRPSEDAFWEMVRAQQGNSLIEWTPEWPTSEWRLDGRGTITDLDGRIVLNPQGAEDAVRRVKRTGGRFRVSRLHLLLVVPEWSSEGARAWLVGQLSEPFRVEAPGKPPGADSETCVQAEQDGVVSAVADLTPGVEYSGPVDKSGGTYRIRQKAGGLIERRNGSVREFAAVVGVDGADERVSNAVRVLDAWRQTGEQGMEFWVNAQGDAYYTSGGQRRFLATVPGGFAWPAE